MSSTTFGDRTHRRLSPRQRLVVGIVATVTAIAGMVSTSGSPVEAGSRLFAGSNPTRLRDTRPRSGPYRRGALGDSGVLRVDVGTRKPVVLNVTAVSPSGAGHITAYPCGTRRPTASVLNFAAAATSNLVIVKPNADGRVCLFARVGGGGSVHLVVDKYGVLNGSVFKSVTANRRLDTRSSGGWVDAQETRRITGLRPHDAVVLNLAVAQPAGAGWLAAYPCGEGYPGTASLNYTAGETRSTLTVVRADSRGRVCIRSSARTHVIADLMGSFVSSQTADVIRPARVMDTRKRLGGRHGQSFELDFDSIAPERGARLRGRGRAVMLNLVAVNPGQAGHVVVWPCSKRRPTTSALNYPAGRGATSNPVVIQPDSAGKVCMWSSAPVDLVVDLGGFLNDSAPGSSDRFVPRTDCRRGSLNFINRERKRVGRPSLTWNESQFKYACAWAHKMATDGRISHWGWGTPYPFGAENVAVGPNIGWIEDAWLGSPDHRTNIVGSQYTSAALAYVTNVTSGRTVRWGVNQFTD